jgi:hypothetical protein
MMNLFDMLTGMGSKRDEYEDFARRYEQGSPSEGYSDQEVLDRYGSVAHNVSATDYEEAAREAFDRLSPRTACRIRTRLAGADTNKGYQRACF